MGFKNSGFPHFGFNPLGFRSSGNNKPPFYSKLIQWFKTATDGILVSLIGSSGSEVNRDCVNGYYLEGDGVRYVDCNDAIIPETDDFEIAITIVEEPSSSLVEKSLIGQYVSGQEGRATLNYATENKITFFAGSAGGNLLLSYNVDEDYPLNIRVKRTSMLFELIVNGVVKDSDSNAVSIYQSINTFIFNGSAIITDVKASTINLNNYTANFETGNQNNQVEFRNYSTGDAFYGTIIGADGLDRVKTTKLESVMDKAGYTESDGVTYYYDEALTQLVPAGKRSTTVNGMSGWWCDDGL